MQQGGLERQAGGVAPQPVAQAVAQPTLFEGVAENGFGDCADERFQEHRAAPFVEGLYAFSISTLSGVSNRLQKKSPLADARGGVGVGRG
ncbi:hypothetical protein ARMA_1501 [Ardenticatena maritima]|uniref:Uncharacterized protein n=1 Tax=Ardenticatena maritima TaxID=872965 RepID=A0A0M9UCL6_9CHLR|nr:hypothetical protein ARMA_1501 [Ardenticatena maritima]